MELGQLPVPLPRRLIINSGFSFPIAAILHSGLRGPLCNLAMDILVQIVVPTPAQCLARPQPASPGFGAGGARLLHPSLPALPCPALPCPALPGVLPPGYQARGGAGPARPAPRCRKGRASVTRGHWAGAFYLRAAGGGRRRRHRGWSRAPATPFLDYKLSTWDG
jgi:hypothetical protein